MILVTELSNRRLALTFIDYMKMHGVDIELRLQERYAELWLLQDEKLIQAETELKVFLLDPKHPRYQAASWIVGSLNNFNNINQINLSLRDYLPELRQQVGTITLFITLLCVLVFIFMKLLDNNWIIALLTYPDNYIGHIQIWRWISHVFLHFSLSHLFFNLMWWWYLANLIERYYGRISLIILFILSAVVSGMIQSYLSGSFFGGLSGVVYSLISYVWWHDKKKTNENVYIPSGIIFFALLWLIIGCFNIAGINTANGAHISGLIIGLIVAIWQTKYNYNRSDEV